jgi:hypothetical protein
VESSSENSEGAGSSESSLPSASHKDLERRLDPPSVVLPPIKPSSEGADVVRERDLEATDMSDWLGGAAGKGICDDMADKLMFWVQGESQAGRRELNKLNQLFGSGKVSKSKQATKPGTTKYGEQYSYFQEMTLQSCSTIKKHNINDYCHNAFKNKTQTTMQHV